MSDIKIKPISAQALDTLSEQSKLDVNLLSKKLRSVANKPFLHKRMMITILNIAYAEGLAAAVDGEVVDAGRCINVDYGDKYEMTCPYCGETYDIDIEAMLPSNTEGFGAMR